MKKITLFVCALAVSAAMFATPRATKALEATKAREAQLEATTITKDVTPALEKKLQDATSYDVVNPYLVYNVEHYYFGTSSKGLNYFPYPAIITPYAENLLFYGLYRSVGGNALVNTWLVEDEEQGTGRTYNMAVDFMEEGPLPLLKTEPVTLGETTYNFVDYQYGAQGAKMINADNPTAGYVPSLFVAPWYFNPFGKMCIYSEDPAIAEEENPGYAQDYFWCGSGYPGDGYKYGTKLVDPFVSTDEDIKYIDTIFVPYNVEGTTFIDHVTVGVVSTKENVAAMFPGEDDHVRLSIYPITEAGIDWENPIARAIANGQSGVGNEVNNDLLKFVFTDEDPITGNVDTVQAVVNGPFIIAFDEFNTGTAEFAFFCSYYDPVDGDTWFVSNDSIFQLYDQPGPDGRTRGASNIMVQLNGLFPVITNAPEVVSFKPGDELTKELTLKTNVWGEDMEIDTDEDWISVEAESVLDGEGYLDYAVTLTITLEESDEVREGIIYIDALGAEYEIIVKQNDTETGIGSVTLKNNGKTYNVLGQEVNEDYKGIIIRNGEKFVR